MYRTTIWLLASCAWGVCLKWALLLQYLPASTFGQHTVCGTWGCGPPLPVLLACHTFWMVLLAPPAVVAAMRFPNRGVRLLGTILIALGATGLISVAGWEAATWLREANEWQRPYFVQRYLFSVVTLVDLPVLEVLLVGAGLWLAESRRSPRPTIGAATAAPNDDESLAPLASMSPSDA
jgi:hypothetical protein